MVYLPGLKIVDCYCFDFNLSLGITTISMTRAPINALNLEMSVAITKALEDAHDSGCKGIILTSSLPTVYCAGLDIMEMYHPDMKRAKEFWHNFQELWLTLYSLELPTVAAINVQLQFFRSSTSFLNFILRP